MVDGHGIEKGYEEQGHDLRREIKRAAALAKEYIQASRDFKPPSDDCIRDNHGEMEKNAELSYRHLEDAAMRIGKCLQAYNGGVSILDKVNPSDDPGTEPVAECCEGNTSSGCKL